MLPKPQKEREVRPRGRDVIDWRALLEGGAESAQCSMGATLSTDLPSERQQPALTAGFRGYGERCLFIPRELTD